MRGASRRVPRRKLMGDAEVVLSSGVLSVTPELVEWEF